MTKKKAITAKDVAKEAGVSQAAVSMILNNASYGSFTEETKKKVFDACAELGYKGILSRGVLQSEDLILLVCPSCDNIDYARSVVAIQQRAGELGYTVLTYSTFRDSRLEANILSLLRTLPVAGVIFLYQPQNLYLLTQAEGLHPTITVCDRMSDVGLDTIELNSYKVGNAIASHLLELGHKDIVYIAMEIDDIHVTRVKRLDGIKTTYREGGLDPEKYVHICTFETENQRKKKGCSEYEAGFLLANLAMKKYNFSAFVGNNDMICYGIIDAIQKKKLKIPQDYSVCGCDNLPFSGLRAISLTSVEHYSRQRAIDAVDMLAKKIKNLENGHPEDAPVSITRVEYEPKIIERNSTDKPRRSKLSR